MRVEVRPFTVEMIDVFDKWGEETEGVKDVYYLATLPSSGKPRGWGSTPSRAIESLLDKLDEKGITAIPVGPS